MSHSCPCCSGISYALCCQPFHKGVLPDNALQLMRSRYAAYALGLSSYIIATTHPANSYYCTDHAKWMQKISESYAEVDFEGLEILDWTEEAQTATVTFTARLSRNKQDLTFTEKSLFEKVEGLWLYLSGQIL